MIYRDKIGEPIGRGFYLLNSEICYINLVENSFIAYFPDNSKKVITTEIAKNLISQDVNELLSIRQKEADLKQTEKANLEKTLYKLHNEEKFIIEQRDIHNLRN